MTLIGRVVFHGCLSPLRRIEIGGKRTSPVDARMDAGQMNRVRAW